MNYRNQAKTILAALLLAASGHALAVTTDVVEAPSGYFSPDDSQKYNSPYYRWAGQDWSWSHSAIGGAISSATLSISAFDVDAAYGEIDNIYGFDTGTSNWSLLGSLAGASDIWSYTTFTLGSSWFDEINAGLQVKIGIDANAAGWAVTLAKSVLNVNGSEVLPPPAPGTPVPVPAAAWLLGSGLIGLAGVARKRKAA